VTLVVGAVQTPTGLAHAPVLPVAPPAGLAPPYQGHRLSPYCRRCSARLQRPSPRRSLWIRQTRWCSHRSQPLRPSHPYLGPTWNHHCPRSRHVRTSHLKLRPMHLAECHWNCCNPRTGRPSRRLNAAWFSSSCAYSRLFVSTRDARPIFQDSTSQVAAEVRDSSKELKHASGHLRQMLALWSSGPMPGPTAAAKPVDSVSLSEEALHFG
jgi:hypothetical protein